MPSCRNNLEVAEAEELGLPAQTSSFIPVAADGAQPTPPEDVPFIEPAERAVLREYLLNQFLTLTRRHSAEDAILVRVIADYHRRAILQAKNGHLDAARSTLRTLEGMARLDQLELLVVHRVSSLPAWALIHWRAGDHNEATRLLEEALDACLELATRFGHDYLTGKRMHLAANTARVLISRGEFEIAKVRVNSLKAVARGNRTEWPFTGSESLDVPLKGLERLILEEQLGSISSMPTVKRGAEL